MADGKHFKGPGEGDEGENSGNSEPLEATTIGEEGNPQIQYFCLVTVELLAAELCPHINGEDTN